MGPGGSKPGGAAEADKGETLLNEDAAFGGEDRVRDRPRAGEVLVHPHDGLVPLAGRVLADGRAVMDHGKRDVSRFPIATGVCYKQDYSAGVDISHYKNIPVPTSDEYCQDGFQMKL